MVSVFTYPTVIAIALLPFIFGCKRDEIKAPFDNETSLISQAQQFVRSKAPSADYEKLDWAKATVYQMEGISKMLRVPLRGNTQPGQKAAYLTYKNNKFSGNYFELATNTITTQSLDNAKKCVAPLTPNGQVRDYTMYVNGVSVGDFTGMAVGFIRPPQYFYINYNLYCLIDIVGFGQGGSEDPSTSPQGVVSYLVAAPDGPQQGGGDGGNMVTVDYGYLNNTLALEDAQYQLLVANPLEAAQVYLYLQTSTQPDKTVIAKEHVQQMLVDTDYMDFVKNHSLSGAGHLVWWEDNTWLGNPNNFSLDFDDDQYQKLKTAEKSLVGVFPLQAYIISKNVQPSFQMSTQQMGAGTNNGLSDKKDAFRHAYFNAINTRDVPPRLVPVPISASAIVRLFADAHETETPQQLQLEAQMDRFNNQVGIDYCWNCLPGFSSDASIAGMIKQMLNQGELRYLTPIDNVHYYPYDKNNPNCATCTNGIIPGVTVLTPTNQ